jgi:very-short-patch-repair endonuclease
MDLRALLNESGGLVATHELHAAGWTRHALERALAERRIVRVRHGWFALPGRDDRMLRAARVGGRLSCRSALDAAGIWVERDPRLHVSVSRNACQLRRPDDRRRRLTGSPSAGGTVVHWTTASDPVAGASRLTVDPLAALHDLTRCATPELVAASASSLLREHPPSRAAWREFCRQQPASARGLFETVDAVCESGTEFVFWWRLDDLRQIARRQVDLPGGRCDFLLGDGLVAEVDGREYHIDPIRFEDDRRRDAVRSAAGLRTLRFSHRQVLDRWPEVDAAVRSAIARGDHHRG